MVRGVSLRADLSFKLSDATRPIRDEDPHPAPDRIRKHIGHRPSIDNDSPQIGSNDTNPVVGFVLMLNRDARKTKDPQLTELAGLMNVKEFSLTIVLAEAVGFEPTIQV